MGMACSLELKVRRERLLANSGLVVAGLVAVACAALAPLAAIAADGPKAAFIYESPVGNAGWTYQLDQGRQCLAAQGVETTFVESVPETPDVANVERGLAEQGYDIVFATGFGYQPFTQQVAKENPGKYFVGIAPTIAPAGNIGGFYGKLWDGRYLTGIVAGSMTKTNKVGYVAPVPLPISIAALNAFALGVHAANPKAVVQVIWTLSWFDPPGEKQAAVTLVESGADVVAQHADTPSAVQGAAEKGAWAIGSESDLSRFAPGKVLTGTVWNWCPYFKKVVDMVKSKTFKPDDYYGGLGDNIMTLAPFDKAVPADVVAKVEKARLGIIDGSLDYWKGPLHDNAGKLVVDSGKTVGFGEISTMNWLAEGISGSLPKK
jgi:basic membrane protein A and related proteins